MQLKSFLLTIGLLISLPCFGYQKITVAFGDALAPWVMPNTIKK
tara:strand:- start:278 stop:409 length:132 start_codon:yes stop_codon:yes gene_type:complete